ncbi:related to Cytosine-specific methyltransferase [Melanopsichium pennsylvanicum]|uniref:Cytosine-specific methyltransferase n=1 Tax=Melanopsichium pennsylvanicum TaxID=63383 RepID=A0AAJ5C8D2_9BASI|nr:related to Cytosine-specific methyltransferase [Melanopsichium pennsylvanicum]
MGRNQRKLVKTTRIVARVLSRTFRIRSGYEVAHLRTRIPPSKTSRFKITSTTEAAIALRAFLGSRSNQDNGREIRLLPASSSVLAGLKTGDIIEASCEELKKLVLISSVGQRSISGFEVAHRSGSILHDVTRDNEVFVTNRKFTLLSRTFVTAKVDPDSVRVRYAWDEGKPAFVSLEAWAAQGPSAPEVDFHEGDYVMLASRNKALLYIVQVHRIRNLDVYVRRLHRQATETDAEFRHERLLFPNTELTRIRRSTFKPVAKCHVSIITNAASSWSTDPTEFFVTESIARHLRPECSLCSTAFRDERRQRQNASPLKAMELMCGAGGLSLGLDLSGVCETKYAFDTDANAVDTFRSHHPTAKVFCGDAGEALQRAIAGRKSREGTPYPQPGQVDIISAGPPCQGFSRMNRHAPEEAHNDPRNLLVCTVLGWVDHLRPKYIVLENVEGFASAKLGGHKQGMVKLVMKCMLEMGYGVTCGFVQSGAFGGPQSRKRFVLIAAMKDLTLPSLPQPTHHFLGRAAFRFAWEDGNDRLHTIGVVPAPALLPAVTVSDAINDLPVFDWKDPHKIYAGRDRIEDERHLAGIPQLNVARGEVVGFSAKRYHSQPRNSYQERMRVLAGQTTRSVTQHQTSSNFDPKTVEQVVNVAMKPGANYDSWSHPSVCKPKLLDELSRKRLRDRSYKFERLDGKRYFKALMTSLNAQGSVIHPTQRRVLTVRECARAQGFPDWVEFHTEQTDITLGSAYRQIGNAVPIPLSNAIGRSIMVARMQDSKKLTQQQESPQPTASLPST